MVKDSLFNALRSMSFVLLIVAGSAAHAQSPMTARVDRETLALDETLTLVLEVAEQNADGNPDFSPLEPDFELLGTQRSSQMNVVNGKVDARTRWTVQLSPRRAGRLTIPPLSLGKRSSNPVILAVKGSSNQTAGGGSPQVFVEVEATPESPYVQAQLRYTVRLYHAVPIQRGSLPAPIIQNALIERLGEDLQFESTRDGKRYRVIERRYAIFPQASGKLAIPAPRFDGQVTVPRTQRRRRYGGFFDGDPFASAFGNVRPVRATGKALVVDVKPRASALQSSEWLPAEALSLTESWSPDPPEFRVGEPVTRTLTLRARGLTAAQLPDLAYPDEPSFKRYPDQPVTGTESQGVHLIGKRSQKLALVPSRSGTYALPAIQMRWWDTGADEARLAELPARTITVLPAAAETATATLADVPAAEAATPPEPKADSAVSLLPAATFDIWPWLASALGLAWLVTLALWLRDRRTGDRLGPGIAQRGGPPASGAKRGAASLVSARRAVDKACRNSDVAAARPALLDWGALRWPQSPRPTLLSLAERCPDSASRSALEELDRAIYVDEASMNWDGAAFLRRCQALLDLPKEQKQRRDDPLPALYPRT